MFCWCLKSCGIYFLLSTKMKLWLLITLFSISYADLCPGGKHECPTGSTCCQLPDKSYGCCPFPSAVCCDDHIHCCPEGSVCTKTMCIQGHSNSTIDKLFHKGDKHLCPSLKYICSDNSTCCETLEHGVYGCCPMVDAVCCSGGKYCCPKNSRCDLQRQLCVGNGYSVEMNKYDNKQGKPKNLIFIPLSPFFGKADPISSVICPDGSYQCPDGYTCCKMESGAWGCCPLEQAICCSDHLHCCPQGMKCDATSQGCIQGSRNVTWFRNEPATHISEVKINICPGGKYKCADGTTCCQLSSGVWGCCQYEDAVCCSDHMHCCPNGLQCDLMEKRCVKGKQIVPWLKKLPAKLLSNHESNKLY